MIQLHRAWTLGIGSRASGSETVTNSSRLGSQHSWANRLHASGSAWCLRGLQGEGLGCSTWKRGRRYRKTASAPALQRYAVKNFQQQVVRKVCQAARRRGCRGCLGRRPARHAACCVLHGACRSSTRGSGGGRVREVSCIDVAARRCVTRPLLQRGGEAVGAGVGGVRGHKAGCDRACSLLALCLTSTGAGGVGRT